MFSNINECSITNIKDNAIVFTWFIRDFAFYDFTGNHMLESPLFPSGIDITENRWYLRLHTNQDAREYFSLHLNLRFDDKAQRYIDLNLSFIDIEGKDKFEVESSFIANQGDNNKGRSFDKFCKKNDIFNKDNNLLVDGVLSIKCKLNYMSTSNSLFSIKPKQTRSQDFENLFESKKFSDIVLSVGNQKFQAHKCILSAQSKVFTAMFEHEMLEKKENVVQITDIQPTVMETLLRFMYSGKIEDRQNIDELLIAADKYELEDLKMICEEELFNSLTLENVGKTLVFADRYRAKELKEYALKFISLHIKKIDLDKLEIDVEKQSSLLIDIIRELS